PPGDLKQLDLPFGGWPRHRYRRDLPPLSRPGTIADAQGPQRLPAAAARRGAGDVGTWRGGRLTRNQGAVRRIVGSLSVERCQPQPSWLHADRREQGGGRLLPV